MGEARIPGTARLRECGDTRGTPPAPLRDSAAFDLAIVGCRGIPAKYGGFETFAEELSTRLAEQGFRVAVACEFSPGEAPSTFEGVHLEYFSVREPTRYSLRKFYEVANDVYFLLRWSRRSKSIYVLGVTANIFLALPKLLSRHTKLIVNVDGLEWRRAKFSRVEKALLKMAHSLALQFADVVVVDAEALLAHIPPRHMHKAIFSPYGVAEVPHVAWDPATVERLIGPAGRVLRPNEFWLAVARLEPENNIETIVEGFLRSGSARPLVVIGNGTDEAYLRKLNRLLAKHRGATVFLPGGVYNRNTLNMFRQHAYGYLHGHSVGGTNPSLLEAMAMRNLIVAHDNEFNREVLGVTGLFFSDAGALAKIISDVNSTNSTNQKMAIAAQSRALEIYSWDRVVERYVAMLHLTNKRSSSKATGAR